MRLIRWLILVLGSAGAWLFVREQRRTARVAQGQTTALTHIANALSSEPDLDTFLGQVLTAIADQLHANWALLFLHDAERDHLIARLIYTDGEIVPPAEAAQNLAEPTPAQDVPLWQDLTRVRRPICVDVATDERLKYRDELLADGVVTLLVVPLLLGQEVIGWFSVRSTRRRDYSTEERELAQALAQQAAVAVQLTRLAEQGRQTAVLEERNRMAREIHDTLAQGLTGITLQLDAAEIALDGDDDAGTRNRIDRARRLARRSLAEARRSVWALRPEALETKTFAEALHDSADALIAGTELRLSMTTPAALPALPAELATDLLRVAQEAITNVVKHADAETLTVELHADGPTLELHIADDGTGFDREQTDFSEVGGFGLTAMRARVERHAGTIRVESCPGAGTDIHVSIPIHARSEA